MTNIEVLILSTICCFTEMRHIVVEQVRRTLNVPLTDVEQAITSMVERGLILCTPATYLYVRELCMEDVKNILISHATERREHGDGFFQIRVPMKVWKKGGFWTHGDADGAGRLVRSLIEMTIPSGAMVFTNIWRNDTMGVKMRASQAVVDNIWRLDTGATVKEARSQYDHKYAYKTGATVRPDQPFSLTPTQCESGIHFFVDRKSALEYGY